MEHLRVSRPVLVLLAILVLPSLGTAQTRPFLYSVWPDHGPDAPKAVAYADVGYGHDLFATLGPERLESRLGSQVRLGDRATVIGQIGWAAGDTAAATRLRAEAEALVSVLAPSAPSVLAFGLGAASDYRGTGVILGRVGAPAMRWHVLVAAGPVLQLTHSTAVSPSPAPRELATRTGYVVRTSIGHRW